ncbi:unnamed protein product [Arctia plantaginis]|uniref:THAP-type domain-containing protein n=1 Tax=Arctia plantaginis TaxID=874455 RepID=A0A8S1BQF9_ARCPL|nr:unnamed protein product [Arctia plantaginis]
MAATQCCVPNCNKTRTDNVILHVFPKPDRESERFDFWLEAIDGELSDLTRSFIFKNRRICHLHFEKQYFTRSKRLASNAIPTLNLPGSSRNSHLVSRNLQITRLSENKDVDDPEIEFLPGDDLDTGMKTANANTHINTSQKENCTLLETDKSSNRIIDNKKDKLPYQQDKELRKENKSIFWKMKLVYILHNTQFCGICLDGDVEMNALTDVFEITDDERTYRRSLRDIVDKVFKKTGRIASSKICINCTKKLIQSYIFIQNAEEKSEMLNYYLTELISKTYYIRNNIGSRCSC